MTNQQTAFLLAALIALGACGFEAGTTVAERTAAVSGAVEPTNPEARSFTEPEARYRLTESGFRNVSSLTQTADGLWRGTATNGDGLTQVAVDYQGAITTSIMVSRPVHERAPVKLESLDE